jgi:SAM-dependent methyltransferase
MLHSGKEAVGIHRQYYTKTADEYDTMHSQECSDDAESMKYIYALLGIAECKSILEVGAGTGRAIRRIQEAMPGVSVRGVEPVAALIHVAIQKNGVPPGVIIQGVGESLPFRDGSIDVVCALGILHHVPRPNCVIREMLRVARKAVLISDGNRFGQGGKFARWVKLGLFATGLWGAFNYLKTRGKGYAITEGDGLVYSYSVYDSYRLLSRWAGQLVIMPSPLRDSKATSWLHPMLTSSGVIVLAIKEPKKMPALAVVERPNPRSASKR